jgi:curved DNA-binding protein CbpA
LQPPIQPRLPPLNPPLAPPLLHRYHPDKNPDNPSAEAAFKQISHVNPAPPFRPPAAAPARPHAPPSAQAYEILSDSAKRREYDLYGKDAFEGGAGPSGPSGAGGGGFGFEPHGFHFSAGGHPGARAGGRGYHFRNAHDIFAEFFGGEDPFAVARPLRRRLSAERLMRLKRSTRACAEELRAQVFNDDPFFRQARGGGAHGRMRGGAGGGGSSVGFGFGDGFGMQFGFGGGGGGGGGAAPPPAGAPPALVLSGHAASLTSY